MTKVIYIKKLNKELIMYIVLTFEIVFLIIFLVAIINSNSSKIKQKNNDEKITKFFDKWGKMTEEEKNKYIEEYKNTAFDIKDF